MQKHSFPCKMSAAMFFSERAPIFLVLSPFCAFAIKCIWERLAYRHHQQESSTLSLQRIESMTSVTQEARCNYLQLLHIKGILTFSMVVTLMMLLMMMAVKNTKNDNDDNEMITKMAMVMTRMMMPMMMQLRGEARCACVVLCTVCTVWWSPSLAFPHIPITTLQLKCNSSWETKICATFGLGKWVKSKKYKMMQYTSVGRKP